MKTLKLFLLVALLFPMGLFAQNSDIVVDYNNPKKYIIGDIKVKGVKLHSKDQVIAVSGLQKGDEITVPSEQLSEVVKRIYQQRFFSNVGLYIDSLSANKDTCLLVLELQERPRVSRWTFKGIKKSEQTDLTERVKLRRGGEFSDYVVKSTTDIIKKYFSEKGFLKTEVSVEQEVDTVVKNAIRVTFNVVVI